MTTYARIVDGFAVDVVVTPPELSEQFNGEWLARQTFIIVPDGTTHGAVDNGDGTFTNPPPAEPIVPKPNNPGNPYFGKVLLPTQDFYALAGQVLGARYPRLRKDDAFLWVADALSKINLINTDDEQGQFLKIVGYLTATNAADGKPLMSAQDVAQIMGVWK